MSKNVYGLELHEECSVGANCVAQRVPGGWIYITEADAGATGWNLTSVFVPFNNEYQFEYKIKD